MTPTYSLETTVYLVYLNMCTWRIYFNDKNYSVSFNYSDTLKDDIFFAGTQDK